MPVVHCNHPMLIPGVGRKRDPGAENPVSVEQVLAEGNHIVMVCPACKAVYRYCPSCSYGNDLKFHEMHNEPDQPHQEQTLQSPARTASSINVKQFLNKYADTSKN